jgi:hypothetical protein
MMRYNITTLLFAVAIVVLGADASSAQVRRYEPARPTISPYLYFFQGRDSNPFLPNYYSFVRPLQQQYRNNQVQQQQLQQQERLLQQQGQYLQRQGQAIGQLQSQFQQFGQAPPMGGRLVAPTGRGSAFMRPSGRYMNASRYFSPRGGAGR